MIIGIHQPNFIPWAGFFNKIAKVDLFVFLDDVQFPVGKSFCYRSKILINGKESWLSIPILGKSEKVLIKDVQVNNSLNWQYKHLRTLELNYKKANAFSDIFPIVEEVYRTNSSYLADYNIPLITKLSNYIELRTDFICSSKILPKSEKTGLDRILEILSFLKAKTYISGSGSGSKRYINEESFREQNINLQWQDYKLQEYKQLKTKIFIPGLSIIDLLFNCGEKSRSVLANNIGNKEEE